MTTLSGQVTTLTRANKISESLRTTVPASIIKQFGMEDGDELIWRLEPDNNRLLIKIEPINKRRSQTDANDKQ